MGASIRKAFELLKLFKDEYPLITFAVSTETVEGLSATGEAGKTLEAKKVSCVHIVVTNI